jgi:hypothetical protein
MVATTVNPPRLFARLDRRYHVVHMLMAVLLAAATIAVFLMWFAPRPAWGPDLRLAGSVPSSTYVQVFIEEGVTALNLDENQTADNLLVARVHERSNWPAGYTVKVKSTNLAAGARCPTAVDPCFWNTDADAGDQLTFTLQKDLDTAPGGEAHVDFTGHVGGEVTWYNQGGKNKAGTDRYAKISYATGTETLRTAGTYEDTLVFTISTGG